ncbi:MAG: DUF1194 domain-containing protein, partial [Kiloniellales bacterium]
MPPGLRNLLLPLAALALASAAPAARAQERAVDLALLLAVDASSSVSAEEFDLQMNGLAAAFSDPGVQAAIESVGDQGIAVALVQWSDNVKQTVAIDWRLLRDGGESAAFSDEVRNTPRFLVGGGTALGDALAYCLERLLESGYVGRRQVIDISGDGRTNQGIHPGLVRDQAVALGITVNGLAILNEDPTVDSYYQYNVIGGTGAFVMTASGYSDFADAIRAKLIREISGAPVALLPGSLEPGPAAQSHPGAAPASAARPLR